MQLGRYQLLSRIASGGMADVYKAKLIGIEGFEKLVAIKKILPHWSRNREFVDMLVDEARTLLHLNFSNIVQVFELGLDDDTYYLVMEYVEGVDLKKLLTKLTEKGEKLPLPVVLYIAKEIAKGLEYAHEKRDRKQRPLHIVHRDISPQNILLGYEGGVKITDFGIAKIRGKTHETVVGTLKGKFAYMSPEQAMGQDVDNLTDLFALGILIFEMMTGKRCFKGQTDMETLEAVRQARVHIPESLEAELPEELKQIVLKLLQKNKQDRYQSASALISDLSRVELLVGGSSVKGSLVGLLNEQFSTHINEDYEHTTIETSDEFYKTKIQTQTRMETSKKTKILVSLETDKLSDDVKPPISSKKRFVLPFVGLGLFVALFLFVWLKKSPPDHSDNASPTKRAEPVYQEVQALPKQAPQALAIKVDKPKTPEPSEPPQPPEPQVMAIAPELPKLTKPEPQPKEEATQFPVTYRLAAFPKGATIRVRSSITPSKITQDVQSHSLSIKEPVDFFVSVEKEGYEPQTFRFNLGSDKRNFEKEIHLKQGTYGSLSITAKPWGRISIPGLISGADTPFKRGRIPSGTYVVKISYPPLKKTLSHSITITDQGLVKCQATFADESLFVCE